jgi:hypothetical protein
MFTIIRGVSNVICADGSQHGAIATFCVCILAIDVMISGMDLENSKINFDRNKYIFILNTCMWYKRHVCTEISC